MARRPTKTTSSALEKLLNRPLPDDPEAERLVLGALIVDGGRSDVLGRLKPEDFLDPIHQWLLSRLQAGARTQMGMFGYLMKGRKVFLKQFQVPLAKTVAALLYDRNGGSVCGEVPELEAYGRRLRAAMTYRKKILGALRDLNDAWRRWDEMTSRRK